MIAEEVTYYILKELDLLCSIMDKCTGRSTLSTNRAHICESVDKAINGLGDGTVQVDLTLIGDDGGVELIKFNLHIKCTESIKDELSKSVSSGSSLNLIMKEVLSYSVPRVGLNDHTSMLYNALTSMCRKVTLSSLK